MNHVSSKPKQPETSEQILFPSFREDA